MTDQLRLRHRAWKYRFHNDRAEIRLLLERLRPGDVALDIGAHKGAYTFWLQRAVGNPGAVYAFEPQPGLARRLDQLYARLSHVRVFNAAVSDAAGRMSLIVPGGGDSPAAHLAAEPADEDASHIEVDVVTIDDVLTAANEQRPVRFIKCDVEGFEFDVFRGAEKAIRAHQPTILFECERRHQRCGRTMADTFAYLETLGLAGSFFHGETLRPIAEFEADAHQPSAGERYWDAPGYCNNFVFEPTG